MAGVEMFWANVDMDGPVPAHRPELGACWMWTSRRSSGYGRLRVGRRETSAHRFSWGLHFGLIPDGLWVLHHCDNPACVRPGHLFLGTAAINNADRAAKGRSNTVPLTGIANGSARLNPIAAEEIRRLRDTPRRELAQRFGVSIATIGRVQRGVGRGAWLR